ncbi:MAG: NmrA family NAD(P)-binding protein [Limisphaerales bacterium]
MGGVIGRALLEAKRPVRAVVRNAGKGQEWADRGCEIALADIGDVASLTAAFQGAEAVFVMVPSSFDPLPEFPEAHALGATLKSALEAARPKRVVYLSTIGAQASQSNLLTQHWIIEQAISTVPMPLTVLRPAWFMENCSWDVAPAREHGVIPSFLQTARQTGADGGDGRHRKSRGGNSSRAVEWSFGWLNWKGQSA